MKYVLIAIIMSGCASAPTVEQMMREAYYQCKDGKEFDPSKIDGFDQYYSDEPPVMDRRNQR